MTYKKKLIEVALPLDAINKEAAREKSIRHGHPSTLHLWWARRPLAAARAVIFASLVDDPSAHPDLFPTEEAQAAERQRLFGIIEELVKWENSNNPEILNLARAEIYKSTGGNPPTLLDPFAGGGSIPLEAQRLNLEVFASDLNPVAVMINKAMIEVPPRFANLPPVNPDAKANSLREGWFGAQGLAEDIRYYGEWMKQEAYKRVGHMYPKVRVPKELGGGEATVVAWIWARTVKCPNPACGCEMPLASSFVLSKNPGNERWIEPVLDYKDKKISYKVTTGKGSSVKNSKVGRGAKFKCILCGESVSEKYIKNEALNNKMDSTLIAIIAEGSNGRLYISPDEEHIALAKGIKKPDKFPSEYLPYEPRAIWCVSYGLDTYDKLFTNRQLTILNTFCELIKEVQQKVEEDALAAGLINDNIPLSKGGNGAKAYAQAVGVYLSFALDRQVNYSSTLNAWGGEFIVQTFGRQALPMVWDYAESNPFSNSTGNWSGALNWISLVLENLPITTSSNSKVIQFDAQNDIGIRNVLISTDPPYYDNIGYADLSDFFYVWMRESLKDTYPELFRTLMTPKSEELIANPYRFNGNINEARDFFERGIFNAFKRIRLYAHEDYPVTIYYAFKQSEFTKDKNGETLITSSGWETMLSALCQAGFTITGTWPLRTERATGLKASVNALASSIVLVCRKRPPDAPICTRRDFINTLRRELKPALLELQKANIAPVDLAQSAIGPGMAVYSRYSKVLEADGSPMSVRTALHLINQQLDAYLSEQEGELDRDSRFCTEMYSQFAFNNVKFGEADVLARAKNTSVEKLAGRGILYAQKGVVRLLTREEIPENINPAEPIVWLLTQQLTRALEIGGSDACARIVANLVGSNAEQAKALAYRLYTIAERKGWAQEAYAYNSLVVAWPEIQAKAAELRRKEPEQMSFNIDQ